MIAFLLSWLMVTAIHADIGERAAEANEPASMDGYHLVQLAAEQGEQWMDAHPPQSCYAAWWALERASLRVLSASLRFYVMGAQAEAELLLQTASITRWLALDAREDVTC